MANLIEERQDRPNISAIMQSFIPGLTAGTTTRTNLYSQLIPLIFKSKIEQKMQSDLIDKLVNGGNGANGNFDISIGPSGITYKQKSPKEKLESAIAEKRLESFYNTQVPQVVKDATQTQSIPEVVSNAVGTSEKVPAQFIRNPNYPISGEEFIANPERKLWEEKQKPYGEVEAGVISKANIIPPIIDQLISKVKSKEIYEGVKVPFGASRVGAFLKEGPWQSFKRGLTAGEGRKAGLLLNEIKTMAFGEGGKALTEGEKALVFSNLDPSYKTEKEWIDSLEVAKKFITEKAELLKKNKGSVPSTKENTNTENDTNAYFKSKYGLD